MVKDKMVSLAVNGTLMRGLELEKNLLAVGAVFDREARTAPCYRLWSIGDKNPGMIRVRPDDPRAAQVDLELWSVSYEGLTEVLLGEPVGLSIGRVLLEDGGEVLGVIAEPELVVGQKEISSYGGWRAYLNQRDLSE